VDRLRIPQERLGYRGSERRGSNAFWQRSDLQNPRFVFEAILAVVFSQRFTTSKRGLVTEHSSFLAVDRTTSAIAVIGIPMGRYPKIAAAVVYVVQVNGRGVVAFTATSYAEARELLKESWFLTELKTRTSSGVPLLDDKAKLSIRTATTGEIETTADAFATASELDGLALAYLVRLDARSNAGITLDSPGLS
jgi:hypothetical protein